MSLKPLKNYLPDTPKELSFLGSSLVRLSATFTVIAAVEESTLWTLIFAGLAWAGHEMTMYFKIHERKVNRDNHTPK